MGTFIAHIPVYCWLPNLCAFLKGFLAFRNWCKESFGTVDRPLPNVYFMVTDKGGYKSSFLEPWSTGACTPSEPIVTLATPGPKSHKSFHFKISQAFSKRKVWIFLGAGFSSLLFMEIRFCTSKTMGFTGRSTKKGLLLQKIYPCNFTFQVQRRFFCCCTSCGNKRACDCRKNDAHKKNNKNAMPEGWINVFMI